jgi:peptidoglycan-associated lipoprotein
MEKNKYFLISLLGLLFITVQGYSQRNKATRAEDAFKAGEYTFAIDLYKAAYNDINDKNNRAEILTRIADCYRLSNEPVKAELFYTKAIGKGVTDPTAYYYLAEAKKMNMKYEEAKEDYKKYKELSSDETRANQGIKSCDLAMKWMDNPSGYQVDNMKFFNSKANDFAPVYASNDYNTVFFTSSRDGSTGTTQHGATGQNFSDIYVTRMDRKGTWSEPIPLGENINTEFEEGTPALSKDFNTMYFTRCKKAKNQSFGCQLYYVEREGDTWGKDKIIEISGDTIVIAHPAITADEQTLYFVSDLQGGFGGKDIWKVTRANKGDDWSKPENLGADINTLGDEVFPFIHSDGTLYFSSNGHAGIGGLDIYKAKQNTNGSWKIENMETPINSNSDDFGIVFQNDVEKGYFSSSRTTRGDDDIYTFNLPPLKFNLLGVVKDEKTDAPIAEANVKSVSSDGLTVDIKTDKNGGFKMIMKAATDYVLIGSKEGYLNGKERETTKGLDKSKDFRTTIYLSSIEKPIALPNIFYDFAKADLRPESMVALDGLVETLNDNPTITIELGAHTDSRGSDVDNISLSQRRAQSVVDYLIQKGIATDRLTAKGYGEGAPKSVDPKLVQQYPFLKDGVVLTEDYILKLPDSDLQEIAHQVNRRTEFRVLRTDYQAKKK